MITEIAIGRNQMPKITRTESININMYDVEDRVRPMEDAGWQVRSMTALHDRDEKGTYTRELVVVFERDA